MNGIGKDTLRRAACALLLGCVALPVCGDERRTVVFLGDSLTDGYTLGKDNSYPTILQTFVDMEDLPFRIVNEGVSGDTTSDGLRRLDKVLDGTVDVLVIALGVNDLLRGLPEDETRSNLKRIIKKTRRRHPDARIVLAGIQVHSSWRVGSKSFSKIYKELSNTYDTDLIPSLLKGVSNVGRRLSRDGFHPNEEGQEHMANTVWHTLEPILKDIHSQ